jgi:hypothetical protein
MGTEIVFTSNIKIIHDVLSVLKNWKPSRVSTIIHSNGLIRTGYMPVAITTEKTRGVEGCTH